MRSAILSRSTVVCRLRFAVAKYFLHHRGQVVNRLYRQYSQWVGREDLFERERGRSRLGCASILIWNSMLLPGQRLIAAYAASCECLSEV